MRVYLPHDHFDRVHLAKVIDQMRELGPPTIVAVAYDGEYVALEGSHRLRAAEELGLMPKLELIGWDETTTMGQAAPGSLFPDDDELLVADYVDSVSQTSIALSFGDDD